METYNVKLKSKSAIAFGRYYTQEIPKLDRESAIDYEARTWIHRAHINKSDRVCIPALAVKNALLAAAKYSSKQIPGQGKKTYTAKFASGVVVVKDIEICGKAAIKPLWLHVPADGMRGGSKRVMKCFPTVEEWEAEVEVIVLDGTINKGVLKDFLVEAGNFIGLGSLRVQNNGVLGRFSVEAISEVKTETTATT